MSEFCEITWKIPEGDNRPPVAILQTGTTVSVDYISGIASATIHIDNIDKVRTVGEESEYRFVSISDVFYDS